MSLKKLVDTDLLSRFLTKVKALIPAAATAAPQMDGTAAVGTSEKYAREDHVHPTDSSLISLGLTGTELVDGDSLALIKTQGNYYFNGSGTIGSAPTSSKFKMVVIKTGNSANGLDIGIPCQILFADEGANSKIYYRYYWSGNLWRDWQTLSNNLSKGSRTVIPSTGANLNDYKTPGSYSFASNGSVTNSPLPESSYAFTLFVIEGNNTYGHGCSQVIFPIDATVGATFTADVYFRRYSPNASDGGWSDWVNIRNPELVNGHTVESDVPANAVFTDTTYTPASSAPGKVASASSTGTSINYARQDHTHGIDLATGDSNGQVKIAGQNVSVKGLKNLAYVDSVTTVNGHTVGSDVPANAFFKNLLEIGSSTTIPNGSDLNDYTTAGRYHTTINGHNISNLPSTAVGSFSLVVADHILGKSYDCYQFLFNATATRDTIYVRAYSSTSGWSDWFDIRDAATVNGHTILSDVPANAVFTDTTYTPASANPLMDGTAAVGTSEKYAREDHVHPRDSKVFSLMNETEIPVDSDLDTYTTPGNYYCTTANASSVSNTPTDVAGLAFKLAVMNMPSGRKYQLLFPYDRARVYLRYGSGTNWYPWHQLVREDDLPEAATATPLAPGTAAVGVSTKYALEDHVHPAQTTINGHTVNADVPSGAVFTDTTYEAASAEPVMDGTAAVGTSAKYAREDHVHPRDSKVFSLMYETEIPVDSDLDTYTTPGNYFCASTSNAKKIANSPAEIAYKLVVVRIVSAARYYQIAFPNGLPNIYIRYYGGSAWTDWVNFRDANKVNGHTVESDVPANAVFTDTTYTPASSAPGKVASSSSTGTSTNYARQDHTHGIDLATGDSNGQVKIAGQNVSVKGLKSLAYADSVTTVNGHSVQSDVPANAVFTDTTYTPASATPLKDGTGAVGTSAKYAREDHVHPTDTTRAALASPTFTGTPKAPTATAGTNSTQIATTAFVGTAVSGKVDAINGLYYGECSTAAATAAKTVTLTDGDGFSLVEGAKVCIRFANANSASNPTLDVNSTGAKPIMRYGTTTIGTAAGISGDWSAGGVVLLVFDGTNWVEHYWHNNTYSSMSVTEYTNGTGTTARTITPARLKAAIAMHSAPKVYTASIPTTGWTTASAYGAYIDVTFTDATFAADDTVFVDLNLSSDTNLQEINDAWACLLRATPTASSAKIRFKFSEIPTVAIPVRAVVM